ncbi:MFS transporter [Pseudarthrobacter sp. P1]|uniref:MFS transporter n=1 Tax=Pseudarthrobacter sp. P1 TaxID=3418418 RepID=UPI003CEF3EF1
MTIVANKYTHVVGVDTHAKTHTYAILVSATGQVADTATFPTSPPGILRATAWMNRRAGEGQVLVSVEGASSYGAGSSLLGAIGAASFASVAKVVGMRSVLVLATILGTAGNLVQIFMHAQLWQVVLSTIISGLAAGLLLGTLPALIAEIAPRDQTGIASGLYSSLKTLGRSAAGAVFGVVLASFTIAGTKSASEGGYIAVWIVCAVTFLLCPIALSFLRAPRRDNGPDTDSLTANEKVDAKS